MKKLSYLTLFLSTFSIIVGDTYAQDLPLIYDFKGAKHNEELEQKQKNFTVSMVKKTIDAEEIYQLGLGYKKSEDNAIEGLLIEPLQAAGYYFQQAAIQGHIKAMHNLGMLFINEGLYDAAYFWFKRASLSKFEPSQRNLSRLKTSKNRYNPFGLSTPYAYALSDLPVTLCYLTGLSRTKSYFLLDELLLEITPYIATIDLFSVASVNKTWGKIAYLESEKRLNTPKLYGDFIFNYLAQKIKSHTQNITEKSPFNPSHANLLLEEFKKSPSLVHRFEFLEKLSILTNSGLSPLKRQLQLFECFFHALNKIEHINPEQFNDFIKASSYVLSNTKPRLYEQDKTFISNWLFLLNQLKQVDDGLKIEKNSTIDFVKALLEKAEKNGTIPSRLALWEVLGTQTLDSSSNSKNSLYSPQNAYDVLLTMVKTFKPTKKNVNDVESFLFRDHDRFSFWPFLFTDTSNNNHELSRILSSVLAAYGTPCDKVHHAVTYMRAGFFEPGVLDGKNVTYVTPNEAFISIIKEAIEQTITNNLADQALMIHRFLKNGGGTLLSSKMLDVVPKIVTVYQDISFLKEYDFSNQLQTYLNNNPLYDPTFLSFLEISPVEQESFTLEQQEIVNPIKENIEDGKNPPPTSGMKFFGGCRMVGSFTYCGKGAYIVSDDYEFNNNIVTDGAVFIKANKFTLNARLDALKGAVIIAKEFDFKAGGVLNAKNMHFIKGAHIDFEKPFQF